MQGEGKMYCFLRKGTSSQVDKCPSFRLCYLTNSVLGFLNIGWRMGQCHLHRVLNLHFFTIYSVSMYLVCPHAFNISWTGAELYKNLSTVCVSGWIFPCHVAWMAINNSLQLIKSYLVFFVYSFSKTTPSFPFTVTTPTTTHIIRER